MITPLETQIIRERGGWTTVRRPCAPTVNDGLYRLMDGIDLGAYGSDFGPRVSKPWITETLRPRPPATISDQVFMGEDGDPGDLIVVREGPVAIEHCHFEGSTSAGKLRGATLRKSLLQKFGRDGLGFNKGHIEQCLMRYVVHRDNLASPNIHADAIQMNNAQGASICASVIYMPAGKGASIYDEGMPKLGVNCIRLVVSTNKPHHRIEDVFVIGNVIAGGHETVQIGPHAKGDRTNSVDSVLFFQNRFGGPEYMKKGNEPRIRLEARGNVAPIRNLAQFDQFDNHGNPVVMKGSGIPEKFWVRTPSAFRQHEQLWGVWNWNREAAAPRFKQALHMIGKATGRDILNSDDELNPAYDLGTLR